MMSPHPSRAVQCCSPFPCLRMPADRDESDSCSSKHPMHEPLRGGLAAVVEAGAVEPEAAALAILDHVIVARLLGRPVPPLRRDAFRALRLGHLKEDATPTELPR